tara:strand:+ start:61 stop:294 length:234 start_codon:yes stop_codon:yes gene_type:complete
MIELYKPILINIKTDIIGIKITTIDASILLGIYKVFVYKKKDSKKEKKIDNISTKTMIILFRNLEELIKKIVNLLIK